MRALLASLLLVGCALAHEGKDLMGISVPRQTILAPIGLVAQPNQYGQYPSGALKVARNMLMRNPGELIQAPDVQAVQSVGTSNDLIHKLMPLDAGHVYSVLLDGTAWVVFENNNAVTLDAPVSNTSLFSATGRISPIRVAERVVFNTLQGPLVGDFMAPASSGERQLRRAGLPQPRLSSTQAADLGNGFLPDDHTVGYAACWVREFSDGYILRSTPTPVFNFRNESGTRHNVFLRFALPNSWVRAGDRIEVYRTDLLSTLSAFATTGDTLKMVISYTVTSTDITNGDVEVIDRQMPVTGGLKTPGEELYTNPGQEGPNYANRLSPIAKCAESFKGFAFYGSTTERAQAVFSVPGGVGVDFGAVAAGTTSAYFKQYGLGRRTGNGTVTNGSAVITGISAADIVGVRVGQRWAGPLFTPWGTNNFVQAVGASTITMNAPAGASTTSWATSDVIDINGDVSTFWNLEHFVQGVSGSGDYEVTLDQPIGPTDGSYDSGMEITLEPSEYPLNQTLSIRATNGQNYSPPLPEIGASPKVFSPIVKRNRIQWSKEQQPEHWPSASEDFVGFGDLIAMNSTRDAQWLWCSDGLFRLSGHAGALGLGEWQVDPAQPTLILAGPQASCSLNEFVYGYTNVGFVEVDSAGSFINLTDKIFGDVLPGQKYTETRNIVVVANETDEEVILILGDNGSNSSNTVYVFSTKQRAWTTLGGNGANLSNITALAMQRSPASGEPRLLFGVSPLSGGTPSYAGWNSASAFLTGEVRYQPIYGDDPLDLKQWIWGDYLFGPESGGKTIVPTWNGTQYGGTVSISTLDTNGSFARAGVPQQVALSHSISPGFTTLAGAPQSRFQGISVAVKPRTNMSKKR